jgi:CRISPR system Cascade subunit CasD
MSNQYIHLWLEAPMQSWGFDSKFGNRDTLRFPTKSAIMGLICCALGRPGEQKEFLSDFLDLDMQVLAYSRDNGKGNKMSSPLLDDYHIVGAGYDSSDPWESLMSLKTAEGKNQVGAGTRITHRKYLQDAAFSVFIEVPLKYVDEVIEGLGNPVWDVYLGRKNCAPTDIILRANSHSIEALRQESINLSKMKNYILDFQVFNGLNDGDSFSLSDQPVSFGSNKKYQSRIVTVVSE